MCRDSQLHGEKYEWRQGNEAQWKDEAVCLFSVFKRVLNMVLSGMVNLIMLGVFAVVFREMFTAVFHGDCVLDGTKEGIALAYREMFIAKYTRILRSLFSDVLSLI